MKKASMVLGICLVFFVTSIAETADKDHVITYNCAPEWANWRSVCSAFQKKYNIRAPHDNKNSGQALTQLMAEKNNPQADVVYLGVTFGIRATEENLLQSYKPNFWDEIPKDLKDPGGNWFTIHSGTVAFQVNKTALEGRPVPRSWKDLLNPIYKGKIGLLDPTSAFVGYAACTSMNIALGGTLDNWDPGIKYLKELMKNNPNTPKTTNYAKVVMGEIAIELDYDFDGYRMKYKDNIDVEVVIPKEGTLVMPYVMGLVKNAPRQDNGKKMLDFVLSDEGQGLWAKAFLRPIRPKAMDKETQKLFLPESEYARAKAVDYNKMAQVMKTFQQRYINEVLK